jgi:hypothetical protein
MAKNGNGNLKKKKKKLRTGKTTENGIWSLLVLIFYMGYQEAILYTSDVLFEWSNVFKHKPGILHKDTFYSFTRFFFVSSLT